MIKSVMTKTRFKETRHSTETAPAIEAEVAAIRQRFYRRSAARALALRLDDNVILIEQTFSRIGTVPVAKLEYDRHNKFWSLYTARPSVK